MTESEKNWKDVFLQRLENMVQNNERPDSKASILSTDPDATTNFEASSSSDVKLTLPPAEILEKSTLPFASKVENHVSSLSSLTLRSNTAESYRESPIPPAAYHDMTIVDEDWIINEKFSQTYDSEVEIDNEDQELLNLMEELAVKRNIDTKVSSQVSCYILISYLGHRSNQCS